MTLGDGQKPNGTETKDREQHPFTAVTFAHLQATVQLSWHYYFRLSVCMYTVHVKSVEQYSPPPPFSQGKQVLF